MVWNAHGGKGKRPARQHFLPDLERGQELIEVGVKMLVSMRE
jgi:hypothetical protein